MEYLNFDLRIGSPAEGRYPVTVINSPAGETSAEVALPVAEPAFMDRLRGIEKIRRLGKTRKLGRTGAEAALDSETTREAGFELPAGGIDAMRAIGSDLFDRLFSAEIRDCFRRSLDRARGDKKGLRIRLRIEAPELAGLPWEYLYDAAEGDYLSLSTETPRVASGELPSLGTMRRQLMDAYVKRQFRMVETGGTR